MQKKPVFITILLIMGFCAFSQVTEHSLLRASSFFYKQRIYVYGYEQQKEQLRFRCFSYDSLLHLKDSAEFDLGKYQEKQYLDISQDTLHDVLNFYFQQADQKNRVSLCRFDNDLKMICSVRDYDANHINSMTSFNDEHYYYKQSLYLISVQEDSTDRQFYLSKYNVKAMDQPFEYNFIWQFPFERKNIHRATIIFSDDAAILLYVHVNDGLKKGQWILRIDALNGRLIKALKINPKGDNRHFLYGASTIEQNDKSISITGNILPATAIDFKKGQADFKNLPASYNMFLICLDSLGDINARAEKALPLPVNRTNLPLHPKIRSFKKTDKNSYLIWADLYEEQQPGTMCYYSSWSLQANMDNETLNIKPSAVYQIPKLIPDLLKSPPGYNYGKLFLKTVSDYDRFLSLASRAPVAADHRHDAKGLPVLLLKKMNGPGGKISWLKVYTNEKGMAVLPVSTISKGQNSDIYLTGQRYILFSSNAEQNQFQLNSGEL